MSVNYGSSGSRIAVEDTFGVNLRCLIQDGINAILENSFVKSLQQACSLLWERKDIIQGVKGSFSGRSVGIMRAGEPGRDNLREVRGDTLATVGCDPTIDGMGETPHPSRKINR